MWWEDIQVGTRRELGNYTFTEEEIIRFARKSVYQGDRPAIFSRQQDRGDGEILVMIDRHPVV